MIKLNIKLAASAALSAALLAGCGGDGGGGSNGQATNASCGQPQTIASGSVADYVQQVIALNENSEPIDINCVTLLADDTAEPVPIL